MVKKEKESSIVKYYSGFFKHLVKLSPLALLLRLINYFFPDKDDKHLIEGWVFVNLMLSIILSIFWSAPILHQWKLLICLYAGFRIFGVTVYQIDVLLFSWYRETKAGREYKVRGYLRILLLLLHNYIEIIFWFAILYRSTNSAFNNGNLLDSFFASLNYSFVTMTNFGHTNIYPIEDWGYVLSLIQSAIGVFMALLILARFISLIPKPKTSDEVEKRLEEQAETFCWIRKA